MPVDAVGAFAPGRVNLIGEHTDYNQGLALPFAIAAGVQVHAHAREESRGGANIAVLARDLDERDEFPIARPERIDGWRAYVRGVVAELAAAGRPLRPARLEIAGELPRGAGLSSSAALEVSVCLALCALGEGDQFAHASEVERMELARLCSRVENDWVGAQTGMLDQIASLFGAAGTALLIDFATFEIEPVPLVLDGWQLAILDSGEHHTHASSGYNERRRECAMACELLGIDSLREANETDLPSLPDTLRLRAEHVLGENERVLAAARSLRSGDLAAVGRLLDASHESLRDSYQISTPAVEAAVQRMRRAGAAGARMVGGGFGGSILGLFAPGVSAPEGTYLVHPGPGAHLLAS